MFKPIDPKELAEQLKQEAAKRAKFREEMRERVEKEWRELCTKKSH